MQERGMQKLGLFAGDSLTRDDFGLTDDGTAYVIASRFAKALGYRDAANATRLLDDDEVGTQFVSMNLADGRRQTREVSVIYEDGIWELIFRSSLPSAKAIKGRVKAILRQLRETGVVDMRNKPMTELEMARRYVAALERMERDRPKVEAYHTFMDADGDYLVGTVAKMLGIGQNTLFARLRAEGVFINGGGRHNTPYQQYSKHFRVVARTYRDSDGVEHVTYTTYVRPSGVDFIHKMLRLREGTPVVVRSA